MTTSRLLLTATAVLLLTLPAAQAQQSADQAAAGTGKPATGNPPEGVAKPDKPAQPAAVSRPFATTALPVAYLRTIKDGKDVLIPRLPMSHLHPSKIVPNLCVLTYRITTDSPECQAFFDQGLGYFYSYVWMEAARSFETALQHDPENAMAWWGLFRALERWGRGDAATKALLKANELKDRVSLREQQLIIASMQEKGQWPNVGDAEARKKAAIATLDNMLAQYDDDEEAWYFRAQLSGGAGGFGGQVSAVPFYKALVRVNPLHPGANHELLHFYEKYQRPALGWVYAEKYIESSPGIPHPFHMQAHLATRLGRWAKTSDRSAHAVELERRYHKELGVEPKDDQQYAHHLEILLVSLIHDGRFAEARAIKAEQKAVGHKSYLTWFRLHIAERDWAEALKVADELRKSDKATASYMAALVYLKQGDTTRAAPEVEVLQHAARDRKNDKLLEYRLQETQGLLMCQTGAADAGLKLLQRVVDKTKNDYSHHAWGNGAYYMEAWGTAALHAGKNDVAEEAFLEALAHDPGSVRAALGLQVLCEKLDRTDEAERYAELAKRCWAKADQQRLDAELAEMRRPSVGTEAPKTGATR
jgi:tetratricopeptide (TPR) repeat protein